MTRRMQVVNDKGRETLIHIKMNSKLHVVVTRELVGWLRVSIHCHNNLLVISNRANSILTP